MEMEMDSLSEVKGNDNIDNVNIDIQQQPQQQEEPNKKVQDIESNKFSFKIWFKNYCNKFKSKEKSPPLTTPEDIIFSFIGSFLGIGLIAALHYHVTTERDLQFLIGSFGASAVLIFGAIKSPLAQPRNLVLGHFISAIVGCTVRIALVNVNVSFASAVAVSLAIVAMHLTKSLHPPGGATSLIAVISKEEMWHGYFYIFMPVLTGALAMLAVALLINNFAPNRKYPVFWW